MAKARLTSGSRRVSASVYSYCTEQTRRSSSNAYTAAQVEALIPASTPRTEQRAITRASTPEPAPEPAICAPASRWLSLFGEPSVKPLPRTAATYQEHP
jgi:hypothetical protein